VADRPDVAGRLKSFSRIAHIVTAASDRGAVKRAPRNIRRPGALLLALVLLAATAVTTVSSPAAAAPASFVVDEPDDAVDAAIDGVCATGTGGCSLRAAVQEAIAHGGTTEVSFAPSADVGALTLQGVGGAEVGDLDVPAGVTLRLLGNLTGPGQHTMVKADQLDDRHVHVHPGGRLELQLVSLVAGSTTGDGGSILNEGQVLITNTPSSTGAYSALWGNHADGVGGAIANAAGAQLEIVNVATDPAGTRVDLSTNDADGGGGAIANDGDVQLRGSTTVTTSHDVYVDNGSTPADGGAVLNRAGASFTLGCRAFLRFSTAVQGGDVFNEGTFAMLGGTLDGGAAVTGGALHNTASGTAGVEPAPTCFDASSQISRSTASSTGGGIHNEGTFSVESGARLTISGAGGGPDATSGGGVHVAAGSVEIDGELDIASTVAVDDGGGVSVAGGTTQTGNDGRLRVSSARADRDGGAVWVGGGVFSARVSLHGNSAGGTGGGLAVGSSGAASLRDSVLASNSAARGGALSSDGTTSILNSTLGQNSASTWGGAVAHLDGALTLRHVSVVDNSPDGVASTPIAGPQLQLQRSLLARNQGQDCAGAARSGGDFNVTDDGTCVPTGNDLQDPSRYGDVGGLLEMMSIGDTDSYGLQLGHPAIDWIDDGGCGSPDRDQRGTLRPQDGDGVDGATCDAGAVEAVSTSVPWRIAGSVHDERTGSPMAGVCVYSAPVSGSGDEAMALTASDGTYVSNVADGEYLMAFFVPAVAVSTADDCGEDGVSDEVQPEWYRNVPVRFEDDDPDGDVVIPDLDDVSLVQVAGADVAGVDACLGTDPDAGLDAPCAPVVATPAGPVATPAAPPSALPSSGSSGAPDLDARAGDLAALPARLAFTGASVAWLATAGLLTALVGVGLAATGRRRRRAALIPVPAQTSAEPRRRR
jgi:hypothetical protein